MDPVTFRNNFPAVKGRTEHTGTGINGEELDIVPAVEHLREMSPERGALYVNITVELVGYHTMESVILYLPLSLKSCIQRVEGGVSCRMSGAGVFKYNPALFRCHLGDFKRSAFEMSNDTPVGMFPEITGENARYDCTFLGIPVSGDRDIIMPCRVYCLKFPGDQTERRCDNQFMGPPSNSLLELPVAL